MEDHDLAEMLLLGKVRKKNDFIAAHMISMETNCSPSQMSNPMALPIAEVKLQITLQDGDFEILNKIFTKSGRVLLTYES